MNTEHTKHLKTRFLIASIIVLLFAIESFIFIDPHQRSCLGNPAILPFAFIGLPLLVALAIIDMVYLLIIKKLTFSKVFINLGIISGLLLFVIVSVRM